MARSAPRLPWPLVEALHSLDGPDRSIADVWRAACVFADGQGFTHPSYEQVRRLVHRHRRVRAMPGPGAPLLEGWLRARSPESAVHEALRRSHERHVARMVLDAEREWRPGGDADPRA
jgi:hypothetical protein